MSFSNEVLHTALAKVAERKKQNIQAYEQLRQQIYNDNPALCDLETQMRMKSSRLALLALSGNSAELDTLRKDLDTLNDAYNAALKSSGLQKGPETYCQLCNDTGYYCGKLCRCVKDIAAEISYSSLIGELPIKDSSFDNFDLSFYSEQRQADGISPKRQMTAVLKTCKNFANAFPSGENLLLTGKSGLGKTHLSLAIANIAIERGFHVIYGSAQNLINEVSRETFDRSGSTQKIDSLNSCDLLILDDLGTEFLSQLSVSIVYNIINTRLLRRLSTIISTNLNVKEISEIYNDRITSRIIGNYSICSFFGNDIRQIKVMNKK